LITVSREDAVGAERLEQGWVKRRNHVRGGPLNTTLAELHAAVLSLPESERAQLAAKILESLDVDPEVEAAWVAEVRDRLAAYKRGEITAVPAEEVVAKARKIVGR
jgi:putative addiction module component (TIGR02574 family)